MTSSLVVLLGAGALIALVVFLAVWRLVPATPATSILEQRLASVPNANAYDIDLETGEFTQPAFERIVLPILSGIGNIIAKRTREGQLQQLRRLVARSGSRQRPETLLALRLILPFAGAAVCLGLAELADLTPPDNILLVVAGVVGGYMYPTLSLERKAKRRQKEILLALSGVPRPAHRLHGGGALPRHGDHAHRRIRRQRARPRVPEAAQRDPARPASR